MTCFVCREEAQELPSFNGDYRFNCSGCGEFRVTTTLHSVIRNRVFDIERTREVLRLQKEQRRGLPGWGADLPILNSDHQYLLRDPD